jgi:hypothetical protein
MVSTLRQHMLRVMYLLIFLLVTTSFWPGLITHATRYPHMNGVARALLAAFAPFVLLGVFRPLHMLPIMLFELTWKAIWVFAIGLPLWYSHQLTPDTAESLKACGFGVIIIPLIIPWRYVWANYIK